jgi:hypothetical protein
MPPADSRCQCRYCACTVRAKVGGLSRRRRSRAAWGAGRERQTERPGSRLRPASASRSAISFISCAAAKRNALAVLRCEAPAFDVLPPDGRKGARQLIFLRHGASCSGQHRHGIQPIVLVVVVLVAVVGVAVPRVARIRRVRPSVPVVADGAHTIELAREGGRTASRVMPDRQVLIRGSCGLVAVARWQDPPMRRVPAPSLQPQWRSRSSYRCSTRSGS